MKAIEATPKTVAQQVAAHIGVLRVAEPFIAWQAELMCSCIPIMTIERGGTGITMTTSYPPNVQEAIDRIATMCKQAVSLYLRQEGFAPPDSAPKCDAIS